MKNNKHRDKTKLSSFDKIIIDRDLNINLLSPALGTQKSNLTNAESTSEIRIRIKNGLNPNV